jgi:methyltransferase (TIGR00027 family)
MTVENVSDTARWVAVYRAMETERPDALFKDPYAKRLAGEKGEAIVNSMKRGRQMAWAMIVRTQVFDEYILQAIRDGADCILNLAAGLDARPWRMELPVSLRWVDADLPGILNYKTEMMKGEKPRCRYEPVTVDLTDRAARQALFRRIGTESKRVLVVTEGLLIYLSEEQVAALADDLHAAPSFAWWTIDLASPMLLKMMDRWLKNPTLKQNAPFKFGPAASTEFFRPHGWKVKEWRSSLQESTRLDREMAMMWMVRFMAFFQSAKKKEEVRRMTMFVLFERA